MYGSFQSFNRLINFNHRPFIKVVYFGNRAIQIHLISSLMKDNDYMNDFSSSGWKDPVTG